jgi:hypothetical protein
MTLKRRAAASSVRAMPRAGECELPDCHGPGLREPFQLRRLATSHLLPTPTVRCCVPPT